MKNWYARVGRFVLLMGCMLSIMAVGATAEEPSVEEARQIDAIIELLQSKGIINAEEARSLLERKAKKADPPAATSDAPDEDSTRTAAGADGVTQEDVQQIEKRVERQIGNVQSDARRNARELKRLEEERIDPMANDLRDASWAKRLSIGGDLRLRYQKDLLDDTNGLFLKPDDTGELMNSTENRERYRGRVRLDLKAKLVDPREVNLGKLTAAVRAAGGNEKDPVSTNETLGDYFNKDAIVLDRYYLQWEYKPILPIWGRLPQITLAGGRMPNPWFCTDLLWDDDLNFEGLMVHLKTDTLDENGWHAFFTAGAFPLQEVELTTDDKWLYAAQVGVEVQPIYGISLKIGAGYFHYENITGQVNDPALPGETDYTAPQYQQKGNTLMDIDPDEDIVTALAADYHIVDINSVVDFTFFFPVHILLEANYTLNIGFDKDEVALRTGVTDVSEKTDAYRFGVKVGYPTITQFGEWNASLNYRYLEADAVVDAFTDSDFHLGGTNTKGWTLGVEYGVYKNMWVRARWLTADEIDGPQLAVDGFQLDLNARF